MHTYEKRPWRWFLWCWLALWALVEGLREARDAHRRNRQARREARELNRRLQQLNRDIAEQISSAPPSSRA